MYHVSELGHVVEFQFTIKISSHNDIRANVNLICENLADLQNTLGEKERAHEDLVMLQSVLFSYFPIFCGLMNTFSFQYRTYITILLDHLNTKSRQECFIMFRSNLGFSSPTLNSKLGQCVGWELRPLVEMQQSIYGMVCT